MKVSYCRSGGGRTGVAEEEWLSVDGDEFQAWRTTGAAAAGRFGGTLTAAESARLAAAVAACEVAEPAHPPVPRPGATSVQIDIDSTSIHYQSGSPPSGRWAALDAALHDLCDAIVDRPTAAIAIEADDDGIALVHRGRDPIGVDLTSGTFVAVASTGAHRESDRWEGALVGGQVMAEPGWKAPIPVGDLGDDVSVHVRFTIGDGRNAKIVEVAHTPEFGRPT
ncbi:MAG TPA: hypothetical protein VFV63_00075 [Ilumatobacteraceae bacterium]|nr:hypothetical protein [Ilumatobacteraceae bacterium]